MCRRDVDSDPEESSAENHQKQGEGYSEPIG